MRPVLYLKQGETILGTLEDDGSDFPWFYCIFKATEAYQDIKPLFDRELELIEMEDWEQFEQIYQQIRDLGLCLVEKDGETVVTDFLLHIEGDSAWFRY
jgi:hypothetical protein